MPVDLTPAEMRAILDILAGTALRGPESWAVGLSIHAKIAEAIEPRKAPPPVG